MPKYTITIEFETDKPLNSEIMNDLVDATFVQLEGLDDGDLPSSEEFGTFNYKNAKADWTVE